MEVRRQGRGRRKSTRVAAKRKNSGGLGHSAKDRPTSGPKTLYFWYLWRQAPYRKLVVGAYGSPQRSVEGTDNTPCSSSIWTTAPTNRTTS